MKHKILMVENDPDDRQLTEEMFLAEDVDSEIEFVSSAILDGHMRQICYSPHLIIVSLNAQANNLAELIACIRERTICRNVPIIVLTDVIQAGDVERCYALGANSFIKKPDNYADTVFKIKAFVNYWFGTVELPA